MASYISYNYASNEERALEFLQRNLLLRSEHPECQVCNRFMTVVQTGRVLDVRHTRERKFFLLKTLFLKIANFHSKIL